MLTIFATSFMTATRIGTPKLRDAPKRNAPKRKQWLPAGHWWVNSGRYVDADKL